MSEEQNRNNAPADQTIRVEQPNPDTAKDAANAPPREGQEPKDGRAGGDATSPQGSANGPYYGTGAYYGAPGNNGVYPPGYIPYGTQGNPYGTPGYPPGGYYPPVADTDGKNAQTFGIIALVGLFVCQLVSVIFGILAMVSAKKSRLSTGYVCSEAKVGRICGLIGLILGGIQVAMILLVIVFYIIIIATGLLMF